MTEETRKRVNDGQPRKPPTPATQLRMFLDLVADHKALMEALPAAPEVRYPQPPEDPLYIARIVRAASIRKFVELTREPVYLPTIFKKLESLLPNTPTYATPLDEARTAFTDFQTKSAVKFGYGDDPHRTVHDVVDDLLNGRFAHADYTKYLYSNVHRRLGPAAPGLMHWLAGAERLVLKTAMSVDEWATDGSLQLETGTPPI